MIWGVCGLIVVLVLASYGLFTLGKRILQSVSPYNGHSARRHKWPS